MGLWPQFRSPLVWDVFAVSTYFTVSLLFWYLGLVPDLATVRDQAAKPWQKKHLWRVRARLARIGARTGSGNSPRICFSPASPPRWCCPCIAWSASTSPVAIVPGWHSTIFPPYFVAGAIYSGFAMVLNIVIPVRKLYKLETLITMRHLNNMANVMLVTGDDGGLRLSHRGVHGVVQRRYL